MHLELELHDHASLSEIKKNYIQTHNHKLAFQLALQQHVMSIVSTPIHVFCEHQIRKQFSSIRGSLYANEAELGQGRVFGASCALEA